MRMYYPSPGKIAKKAVWRSAFLLIFVKNTLLLFGDFAYWDTLPTILLVIHNWYFFCLDHFMAGQRVEHSLLKV